MPSMLDTIQLVVSAMTFGAAMEKMDMLATITIMILGAVHSAGSLILATLCTALGLNIIAGDQYISIVVPWSYVSGGI